MRPTARPLLRLGLAMGLIGGGVVLGASGSLALFLHRVGLERLPLAYAVGAVGTVLGAAARSQLLELLGARALHSLTWIGLPLTLALLAGLVLLDGTAAVWGLMVACEALGVLQLMSLWRLASRCFDGRAARGAYPRLSAARVLGGALGAVIALGLPLLVGAAGLVLAWIVLSLWAGLVLGPLVGEETAESPLPWAPEPPRGRALWRSSLLSWLAVFGLLVSALATLLHYAWSAQVEARFVDEVAMARVLGAAEGGVTLGSLLAAVLAGRFVFPRLGASAGLVVQAGLLLVGFGLLAVAPGLPAILALEVASRSWLEGAGEPSYNASLHGLRAGLREQGRTLVEGVCLPLGVVLASGVLALGADELPPRVIFALCAGASAPLLLAGLRVRRAYSRALHGQLRLGVAAFFGSDPARAVVALDELEELRRAARSGLTSPEPTLRRVCLDILSDPLDPADHGGIRGLLADPEPGLRGAAVGVLSGVLTPGELSTALADASVAPVLAALSLLRSRGGEGTRSVRVEGGSPPPQVAQWEPAHQLAVEALLDHADADVAAEAAAVLLGRGTHPGASATLCRLAAGPAEQALPALVVLAAHPQPEASDGLRAALQSPSTQLAATEALLAKDPARAAQAVVEVLSWTPDRDRSSLGRALARHPVEVVPPLLAALDDPTRQGPALELLGLMGAAAPPSRVRAGARALEERFEELRALQAGPLAGDPLARLLSASIEAHLHALARHLVSAALAGQPAETVIELLDALDGPSARRSPALELAETLGDRTVLDAILPWLEGAPSPATPLDPRAWLARVQRDRDPWIRACGRALAAQEAPVHPDDVLAHVHRVATLRAVSLFAGLDLAELRLVAESAEERMLAAGEALVQEGEPGDCVYFIVEGEVVVFKAAGQGVRELARRGPGAALGELGVLTDAPRMATAVAVGPCRVLRLDRATFRAMVRERPHIGLAVIDVLSQRLRDQAAALAELR